MARFRELELGQRNVVIQILSRSVAAQPEEQYAIHVST